MAEPAVAPAPLLRHQTQRKGGERHWAEWSKDFCCDVTLAGRGEILTLNTGEKRLHHLHLSFHPFIHSPNISCAHSKPGSVDTATDKYGSISCMLHIAVLQAFTRHRLWAPMTSGKGGLSQALLISSTNKELTLCQAWF